MTTHQLAHTRDTSYVAVVAALTWDGGQYSARCLGFPGLHRTGESMIDAVANLADELSRRFSAGEKLVEQRRVTDLWQPLPVEMLTAVDVAVP